MSGSIWTEPARKAAVYGAVLGYFVAVLISLPAFVTAEFSPPRGLTQGLAILAISAAPPSLAALAYPRRPLMLMAAALTGVASVLFLYLYALPFLLLGLIWFWAYIKIGPGGLVWRTLGLLVVPLLVYASSLALWIHVDPYCEQRLTDGTVRVVDAASRGLASGWAWEMPNTYSGEARGGVDVQSESCSSDTVTYLELAVVVVLTGAGVGLSAGLASATPEPARRPEAPTQH